MSTATRRGAGGREFTLHLGKTENRPVIRLLRLLPPELLRATVKASSGQVDSPIALVGGEALYPTLDAHLHLFGAIPEGYRWRALMSARWSARGDSAGDPDTELLNAMVGEAQWLRMTLVEAFVLPSIGWSTFIATLPVENRLPVGMRGLSADEGVAAQVAYRRFIDALVPLPNAAVDRYGDPLQAHQSLPRSAATTEFRLLSACIKYLRQGSNGPLAVLCCRYVWIRSAIRAQMLLNPSTPGLAAFAHRFSYVGGVDEQEGDAPDSGVRRPAAENTRLLEWAAEVTSTSHATGAHLSLEVRLPLGKEERLIHQSIRAVIAGVRDDVRVSLVQQVHRGRAVGPESASMEAAVGWKQARANVGAILVAVDVAGPEQDAPPWKHARALRRAKAGGLALRIHAGESYGAPVVGLHWIMWSMTQLDMGSSDRIGHALALLESPGPGLTAVRDWGLALGWLWSEFKQQPELDAELRDLFLASGLPGVLDEWAAHANGDAPSPPKVAGGVVPVPALSAQLWRAAVARVEAEFAARGVLREVCPSSNMQVSDGYRTCERLHSGDGVGIVVGSDDPGILGTTMRDELSLWLATGPSAGTVANMKLVSERLHAGMTSAAEWQSRFGDA